MFLEIAAWLAAAGLGLEPSDNFPTGFLHDSVHRRNFETQKMGATISRGQSDWCLEQKGRHQEPQSLTGRLKAPSSANEQFHNSERCVSVRVDFAIELHFFELWSSPFHGIVTSFLPLQDLT